MIDLADPSGREAAAGEYVLGTLDAQDRSALEAALPRDAGLRRLVGDWQDRLLPLTARAAPAEPSPQLWRRIDGAVAGVARPRPPAARAAAWWQRLGFWQALSGVAVAASLLMGVLWLGPGQPPPAGPRYLAMLQSPDGQSTGWVVELRPGGVLRLAPVGDVGRVPSGRAWQFWTKPEGAAQPTSLGLVQPGQALELPATRLPAVGARQLFEITLEPEGGSATGRPTGPILYVGRTVAL